MYQSTTPSLSQTIWPRWASRQLLSLPIVQTLLPVTFGYSLSSEAVVMRQLRRGCNESHWHAHTRGLRWGLREVVGTVQQVHCSRKRLLGRGLELHMCSINKSAHAKNLFNDPRVCVCVCVCVYPPPLHKLDVTQGQFFQQSLTRLSFLSWPVVIPRPESPVYPSIYPYLVGE